MEINSNLWSRIFFVDLISEKLNISKYSKFKFRNKIREKSVSSNNVNIFYCFSRRPNFFVICLLKKLENISLSVCPRKMYLQL